MEGLICDFLEQDIVRVIKKLIMANNHKVIPEELMLYLKIIHSAAIKVVGKIMDVEFSSSFNIDNILDVEIEKFNWDKAQEEGIFRMMSKIYKKYEQELLEKNLKIGSVAVIRFSRMLF